MKTLGEMKNKIKRLTCNEDSEGLSEEDICCFISMGQRRAMKLISCLNKEFFTSCSDTEVAIGTESIDLPEDILATKIKAVYWIEKKCHTKMTRGQWDCISEYKGQPNRYVFFNKTGEGKKLYLNCIPSKAGKIRVIYERTPPEITDETPDTYEFEFPECCDFIFQYAKLGAYEFDSSPMTNLAIKQLDQAEGDLTKCMSSQFQDGGEIQADEDWSCYLNEY